MISLFLCIGLLLQTVTILAQPPDTSRGTCVDITFMLDVSCSVSTEDMDRGVEFALMVLDNLDSKMTVDRDTTVRVAFGLFVDRVIKVFYLKDNTENKAAIRDALENARNFNKPDDMKCKTFTHYAVDALNNEYFNKSNGDREDFRNVAIIITDARTSSRKWVENGHLERYLDDAEEANNDIYTVLVKNNRGKEPLDEGLLTGNDTSKLYDIREGNDEEEAERLADWLNFAHACPQSDEPSEDCGEIIFVLDVSCSITAADKDLSTYVANKVFTKVYADTMNFGVGVSLVVFDDTPRISFHKDKISATVDDIATMIIDTNVTHDECRTKPAVMFQDVSNAGLDVASSGAGKPVNMVLFYDGMTSPPNQINRTYAGASGFKNKLNTKLLLVKLENDRGKNGTVEFDRIQSSDDLIFPNDGGFLNDANKDSVAQKVADKIIDGLKCPAGGTK